MENDLVLITGASSDIGLALMSTLLATTGSRLLAHSFSNPAKFDALIAQYPDRVAALTADLSTPEGAVSLADAVAAHGTPSAIVHLPALRLTYERFTKLRWERMEQDMAIQLRSIIVLLQRFLPKMAKLERARVLFMLSSVVHGVPPKYMSSYSVVKYAQLGLMRALAADYAGTPVRINAVAPSMVATQFLTEIGEVAVQLAAAGHPLGRNATPADVVGAMAFLLSPAADYISGVSLPVAGGTAN